jgi:hypothetical protein
MGKERQEGFATHVTEQLQDLEANDERREQVETA